MLPGTIRSQIDAIWDAFWTGGISNPLEVIEQITYLLFLKRLDAANKGNGRANRFQTMTFTFIRTLSLRDVTPRLVIFWGP